MKKKFIDYLEASEKLKSKNLKEYEGKLKTLANSYKQTKFYIRSFKEYTSLDCHELEIRINKTNKEKIRVQYMNHDKEWTRPKTLIIDEKNLINTVSDILKKELKDIE